MREGERGKARRALATLRSLADPRQVGFLIAFVTNRCNFRCAFCFYHAEIAKNRKPDELTVAEHEAIASKIGPLVQLSLTGGEPFLHGALADIARAYVSRTGARYVTVPTNAWFTDRMVGFLEEILPAFGGTNFRLMFSIDGIGDEHDTSRSQPGSWARILESYRAVSALRGRFTNLVLDANTVYTARSEASIVETLRTLDATFRFDNLSITYARGDIADPTLAARSREAYLAARAYLISRPRQRENRFLSSVWRAVDDVSHDHLVRTVFDDEHVHPCVAGRKLVVLGETGDVRPCEILERPMGNVRDYDYDLRALLDAAENRRLVRWIEESRCKCSFECAQAASVVWRADAYPEVARAAITNLVQIRASGGSRPPQ
jgi:MoaA/NifB/PqqE/SkfB family radical SAM enzyme